MQPHASSVTGRLALRAALVVAIALAWASLFWFVPPQKLIPPVGAASQAITAAIRDATGLSRPWVWVTKSALLASVFIALSMLVHGRRRTGLALPSTTGMRMLGVALCVALPIQVALGLDPAMHAYYKNLFAERGPDWIAANGVVMLIEHMFVEGAVLALALPGGLPDVDERRRIGLPGLRFLARIGIGRVENPRLPGPRTFLTIPVDAWPAVIAQGLVFGCIHFTKAPNELLSAFPGGVAVGWITVRTGSVWPAATLHLATGAIVLLTMTLARGG